jgi:hypothetical protein
VQNIGIYFLFLKVMNMNDTLETNLPEGRDRLEDTKAPVEVTENSTVEESKTVEENSLPKEAVIEEMAEYPQEELPIEPEIVVLEQPAEVVPELVIEEPAEEKFPEGKEPVSATGHLTKEEILKRLETLLEDSVEKSRGEIESLRQSYYKIHRVEIEDLKKKFVEGGGIEEKFVAPEDETEDKLKELLATYREKRATVKVEEDRIKAANYALKLQIIDRLKVLTESQDDFNKLHNEFKDIQQRWKEIKQVPQEHAGELWRNYQAYSEKFYDIIKINNQFRDYDFKKNLELKTVLCETVEKLESEPEVISAFHQLQKLHQQWREIGPVSKELRESLWARFKAASAVINKRHQEHFDGLKGKEQENLEAKKAICEKIEAIDFARLKSFKDWEAKNKEVITLQNKWKTIGFAPKKYNVKIFERFRAACDGYFNKKSEFYKSVKEDMEKNLEKKHLLCEQAEALKESMDWKDTTDKMVVLQKEWKTIGPVARKHSDAVWKRFITACDSFFEQKNKNVVSQKSVEYTNLAAKKELIAKINSLDGSLSTEEALAQLREYTSEWNAIGFVPFKEKDKI